MTYRRPIAVDLFAGAGGLSLGFEQAGFDVAAAVEVDPVHACAHQFNFPDCAVIPRSVSEVSGKDICAAAGLTSARIDVVIGGAPCQGFSLMGQRALDDPRNSLVREYIRLVRELQPSYFLFENVKGLTVGKHGQFLNEIIQVLSDSGYVVLQPWQVLNAKDYGVPQSRERLFLVGAKAGSPLPRYPIPLKYQVTCAEALGDLPDAEQFEQLMFGDEVRTGCLGLSKHYSSLMRCSTKESWKYGYPRRWNQNLLTSSRRSQHTTTSRRRFEQTEPGTVEPISRFFRLSADGVSNTLRAGTDSARGAFTSPRPIHYRYARCVTVREMARLHGFPDWFRFHETKWHGARQVGNSVPPPLAFAIAQELIKVLPTKPICPTKIVALGDRALLSLTMSSASRYWGIRNPIKKRNRKSGQRKRKQTELFPTLTDRELVP
ncbi:DNA cytosine methyltransferase [Leptolyngbya sp. BC1307]|uniref:DNA cytosine methyltransferase n=1 Tax=Leptolyngbya sp. BC1307 TaxID=2029589 RepID=UPI000EFC7BE5|nr:DNA cytosine methyltransferase [Leptolyngbya sp. BC1307]